MKSNGRAKAEEAMERAAAIGGKPEHAYQGGVMRLQLQQADAALKMLPPLEKQPRRKRNGQRPAQTPGS
ncbi:MAG: hypothetical protein GY859_20265 [Desulfobacterales bacterium]|nr:hypothetical protein [Desulfobacterales bacterium]